MERVINLKCSFHNKVMKVYKLMFSPSKKSVNFCYNKVFLIFFQKGFVRMILKIILVNNVLLVLDMIIQQYMILDIMTTQLRIRPIGGNVQGPAEKLNEICNEPLPKQRK